MKKLLASLGAVVCALSLASCGGSVDKDSTEAKVAKASKMTLAQLEKAAEEEMTNSKDTFKVVGLTSVLAKAMTTFEAKYEWIKGKTYCKNDYKDYQLLTALDVAENDYFADYALVQDVRSIAQYDGELLHNYVPSDYKELGLTDDDIKPLKGVAFNKLFWTNSNFTNLTKDEDHPDGMTLYNIWQLAGSSADKDHIADVSFQSPTTEQINMSFLVSMYEASNNARVAAAFKKYYGKDWVETTETDILDKDGKVTKHFTSAGDQWVYEFIKNISVWHGSDGTAMKETQLKTNWKKPVVYYGAFAKMKDAVGKFYAVSGQDTDEILKDLVLTEQTSWTYKKDADGKATTEKDNVGKVCAMHTVKWDWEIEGFNGFYYNMCSQIVNNAKHPFTACLYARNLLTQEAYEGAVYNGDLQKAYGLSGTVNQYGYYFPGSNSITYAKGDWTRDVHCQKEIVEDYSFLSRNLTGRVNEILTLVASNPGKAS